MTLSFEHRLADELRILLGNGTDLGRSTAIILTQILAVQDAGEIAARLTDCVDAEAQSMRDLALYPDSSLALALERWRMNQEETPSVPDVDILTEKLKGAPVVLILPDGNRVRLTLERDEALALLTRLHLRNGIPAAINRFLADQKAPESRRLVPELRLACRQTRSAWTPGREDFVLTLLRGCFLAPPQDPLRRRTSCVLSWCLEFLEHAGDDVLAALARRRDELRKHLDQAAEMERTREKYNFEIRRMLGIAEQHLDPTALQEELALLELTVRATGGCPQQYRVMRQNLGEAGNLNDMRKLMGDPE